jgi:tripartite-type tricarboxylate transporter receptor subunit TctC
MHVDSSISRFRALRGLVFSGLGLGLAVSVAPSAALAQWQPERPIEFVIQTSPGGGSDIYARMWISIIEKYDLSPVPVTPVNMPGGAGAVALTYLASKAGDPHFMSPTLNSVVTTSLQQEIPVMYPSEDLTPIALLAIDPFLLWVTAGTYADWASFQAACQADRLTGTGTGARTEDEIQIGLIQQAGGCQPFRYVPASGGGEVAASVAGGQMAFSVNQPAEAMPHVPDRLKPIVAFAEERFDAFADVPTHWELGVGADNDNEYAALLDLNTGLHQMRGIIGPPDMPPEAVAWYENLWRQVFDSPEWQEFMAETAQVGVFMGAEEYRAWLKTFEDNHVRVMRDVFAWELRPDLRARQN